MLLDFVIIFLNVNPIDRQIFAVGSRKAAQQSLVYLFSWLRFDVIAFKKEETNIFNLRSFQVREVSKDGEKMRQKCSFFRVGQPESKSADH